VFDDVDSFGVAFDDDLPWAAMSANLFITPAPDFPPPLGPPPYIPGAAWIYEEMKEVFGEWMTGGCNESRVVGGGFVAEGEENGGAV
jgi:hypothetical protein